MKALAEDAVINPAAGIQRIGILSQLPRFFATFLFLERERERQKERERKTERKTQRKEEPTNGFNDEFCFSPFFIFFFLILPRPVLFVVFFSFFFFNSPPPRFVVVFLFFLFFNFRADSLIAT